MMKGSHNHVTGSPVLEINGTFLFETFSLHIGPILDDRLKENSSNPERVSFVFTFVFVCLCVCVCGLEYTTFDLGT